MITDTTEKTIMEQIQSGVAWGSTLATSLKNVFSPNPAQPGAGPGTSQTAVSAKQQTIIPGFPVWVVIAGAVGLIVVVVLITRK